MDGQISYLAVGTKTALGTWSNQPWKSPVTMTLVADSMTTTPYHKTIQVQPLVTDTYNPLRDKIELILD